jgi:hypothetical protein
MLTGPLRVAAYPSQLELCAWMPTYEGIYVGDGLIKRRGIPLEQVHFVTLKSDRNLIYNPKL